MEATEEMLTGSPDKLDIDPRKACNIVGCRIIYVIFFIIIIF